MATMTDKNLTISINKEQLSGMPTAVYPGCIAVVTQPEEAESALSYLRRQDIVGIDTETRPSFRKGRVHQVSLVQIATEEICYLFRVNKLGFTDGLRAFLEDKGVVKVGLSLKDDFFMLRKLGAFEPCGYVELQSMVKNYSIKDASLQKIYGIIFGERISKSQRLSNWEALELSPAQQQYASVDAWACLRIYRYLKADRFVPELSEYIVATKEEYIE